MRPALAFLAACAWRALLVAAALFGAVAGLARWKAQPDPFAAPGLLLSAAAAHVNGPGEIRRNVLDGVDNIGWWDYATQGLSWELDVPEPGAYRATLQYARAPAETVDLTLVVGAAELAAEVPATGGWRTWRTQELGTITLAAGTNQPATLRSAHPRSTGIINFARLVLTPVK